MPISLRNYVYGLGQGAVITPGELTVYATNTQDAFNGGKCCLWTVPPGVSKAVFEIWSGGGSGGGACCCMMGGGAGSGGYAVKSCTVTPGQTIQICAAGSQCCGDYSNGNTGCPSWVCATSVSTWLTCVPGGVGSARCVTCFYGAGCYTCCSSCWCCGGIATNADYYIPGTSSTGHGSQYCYDQYHQYSSNAYGVPGPRLGPNGCCAQGGGTHCGMFPGGGGLGAQAYGGGCCCGGWGAGGIVYVMYM